MNAPVSVDRLWLHWWSSFRPFAFTFSSAKKLKTISLNQIFDLLYSSQAWCSSWQRLSCCEAHFQSATYKHCQRDPCLARFREARRSLSCVWRPVGFRVTPLGVKRAPPAFSCGSLLPPPPPPPSPWLPSCSGLSGDHQCRINPFSSLKEYCFTFCWICRCQNICGLKNQIGLLFANTKANQSIAAR